MSRSESKWGAAPRVLAAACALGPMLALMPGGRTAFAQMPPPDPNNIFTFQWENASIGDNDRYYTNGLRLGLTRPTGDVPDVLAALGHGIWGDGEQRIELGLSQLLFTPRDTQISPPNPQDRPNAGLLFGSLSLMQDTARTRSAVTVDLGVIGPAALGKQVQNGFHAFIGQHPNRGWNYQLPNQPLVELTTSRTWRLPLGTAGPVEFDVLPTLEGGVGLWRDYALAGGQVRMGQGLTSDFGAARIDPGLNGLDAYQATRPFVWYLFAGGDGQAVGYDETIDGEPFRSTANVSRIPFVGEFQFGLAIMAWGARLTLTDVLRSHEFRTQTGGLFQFASAAISFKF